MKQKLIAMAEASLLVLGIVTFSGCFEDRYGYGSPRYGYGPYAYSTVPPEYTYEPRGYSYDYDQRPYWHRGNWWTTHHHDWKHRDRDDDD
jgi:hypothetical protein